MESEQYRSPSWIVGVDEVGRGPLAGPVYVCAVAMPLHVYKKTRWKGLTDSKLMTPLARARWFDTAQSLKDAGKLRIAMSAKSAEHIDEKGISYCIKHCVHHALRKLGLDPADCLVLLDGGLRAPIHFLHQQTIIKGDRKKKIIALASVAAKVTRDCVMRRLHKQYPDYRWFDNKGYGTEAHIEVLRAIGASPLHRKTFLSALYETGETVEPSVTIS